MTVFGEPKKKGTAEKVAMGHVKVMSQQLPGVTTIANVGVPAEPGISRI